MSGRIPQNAATGLVFPSGEDVVFELRAKSEPELVLNDRDLVLNERAVDVVVFVMWRKVDGGHCLNDIAGTPARSRAPDDVVTTCKNEMMDEVEIEGVTALSD